MFSLHPTVWLENISSQAIHRYSEHESISLTDPSSHITCELLQTLGQEETFLGKNVDFLL